MTREDKEKLIALAILAWLFWPQPAGSSQTTITDSEGNELIDNSGGGGGGDDLQNDWNLYLNEWDNNYSD